MGILKLNIDKPTADIAAKDALELERIYFLKATSGKGLGRLTLQMAEDFARARNKKIIWLKAMKDATVVSFYEKQGYVTKDETELNFPLLRNEFRKMVIMHKTL